MIYLIDAYNLIHRVYPDWLRSGSLESARAKLESRLSGFQKSESRCRLILCYDGQGDVTTHENRDGSKFELYFSQTGVTADELILDLCRELEGFEPVTVVTSDLADIGNRVRGLEAQHVSSEEFAKKISDAVDARPVVKNEKPDRVSSDEADDWLRTFDLHPEDDT